MSEISLTSPTQTNSSSLSLNWPNVHVFSCTRFHSQHVETLLSMCIPRFSLALSLSHMFTSGIYVAFLHLLGTFQSMILPAPTLTTICLQRRVSS